ncbi:hypothetical protein [Streptomyces cyaneofuscatus]|uniref:hypothetical protein n=1 Tax=Streptomyces cyaneofuscatus TaxID=66883 RepID=UPI003440C83D
MADIEELLTDTPVRLAPAAAIRARGDRRRTRRRVSVSVVAAVAAGAMGLGAWAGLVLPNGSGGTQVAGQGANPFMSDGVVQNPDPWELPGNEVLDWQNDEPLTDYPVETAPLPQVGLDTACGLWSGYADKPAQQFTSLYSGNDGARARHRVLEYATPADATAALKDLDVELVRCGVERAKGKAAGRYTGVTRHTAAQLNVTVKSWGRWIAVQETQLLPVELND